MAKRITSALLHFSLFTIPFLSSAAIPVRWTVDTFRVKPLVYDCYHGETLDLAAAMTAYGDPLDLHGKTARLYWQTNGMDAAYWSTNANVSSVSSVTNVLSATFVGSFDPGAPSVSGFIGVEGENYRAAFTLNFRPSPGFTPAHISPPVKVLDFATTTVANPDASPFMVKGGSGGVTAQQATNIASAVVAPISSTQSVHSATLSSHTSQLSQLSQSIASRTTTNDVNAIIASSNLCTVAAAQAMTDGVLEYADDTFLKTSPGGYGYINWEGNALYVGAPSGLIVSHISTMTGMWEDYRAGDEMLTDYIASTSVTNGGAVASAKAYADATFLKTKEQIYWGSSFGLNDTLFIGSNPYYIGFGFNSTENFIMLSHGSPLRIYSDGQTPYVGSTLTPDGSDFLTQSVGDNRYLKSYTETDPTATAKAQAEIASTLSGRTYDFANGVNFTKNLYTALTNVIQTLGGTVTNPPNFN